jgi:hypothetical protein
MDRHARLGGVTCGERHGCRRIWVSGVATDLTGTPGSLAFYAEVHTLWIGGCLGETTVWITDDGWTGKLDKPHAWQCVHKRQSTHEWRERPFSCVEVKLRLDTPFKIWAGRTVGLYVHASESGGIAIRGPRPWAEDRPDPRTWRPENCLYADGVITVEAGCAHHAWVPEPFGVTRQWGVYRELEGMIAYTPCWRPWSPHSHARYPCTFRRCAETFRVLHGTSSRGLPRWAVECVLGLCHPDWFLTDDPAIQY